MENIGSVGGSDRDNNEGPYMGITQYGGKKRHHSRMQVNVLQRQATVHKTAYRRTHIFMQNGDKYIEIWAHVCC